MSLRRFLNDASDEDVQNVKAAYMEGRIDAAKAEAALMRLGYSKQAAEVVWTQWDIDGGYCK
jgi:hypothetical protein